MHYASHVCMNQTDEFEVAGSGKSDGKALPLGQSGSADASGAIKAAETASRKPRTTYLKSRRVRKETSVGVGATFTRYQL